MGKYSFFFFKLLYTHFFQLNIGLHAGKTRFLGDRAVCQMRATRKWSHRACAQRIDLVFRGKTSADQRRPVLYLVSIFYVNQTDSVLNFARGQTLADDTCVY